MQYLSKKTTLLVSFLGSIVCSFIGFFVLLAGAFYRIFYRTAGSFLFWITALLASSVLISFKIELALIVFAMWLVVGLYSEVEIRGKATFAVASGVVLIASTIIGAALWFVLREQNLNFSLASQKVFEFLVNQQNQKLPENFPLEKIGAIVPSVIVIFLGMILGFGLMLERRISRLLNVKFDSVASQIKLQNISVSDYLIWPLIVSFAVSFAPVGEDIQSVGLNVFIVISFMYWFQGLAVAEFVFKSFRLGPFSRILFYILIVLQMPFVLSAIGIIDFWFNFRKRLKKTKVRTTTQNGENL